MVTLTVNPLVRLVPQWVYQTDGLLMPVPVYRDTMYRSAQVQTINSNYSKAMIELNRNTLGHPQGVFVCCV